MNEAAATPPSQPARREFLSLASGCLACGLVGIAPLRAASGRSIDVGTAQDYPADVISEKFIEHDLFVIRHGDRLFACSATCPHKANALLLDPQNPRQIICSGHDSKFSPEGLPLRGPARRPLVRYAIAVNAAGRLLVDRAREFPRSQWDDAASFIRLGKS